MVQGKVWSVAVIGGLVVAGAALGGCGRAGAQATAHSGTPTASRPAPTTGAPTTTAPATSAPTTGVPSTTTPTTAAPATTVPDPTTSTSAAGGAGAAPSTTSPSTGSRGGEPVLLVLTRAGSVGYEGRQPSTIDFSGDSTNIVDHLSWSLWGSVTAVGHGTLGINDCQPNCAQGTITEVPATIDLGGVVNGHFTSMTERATDGVLNTYSYPSRWAMGAS